MFFLYKGRYFGSKISSLLNGRSVFSKNFGSIISNLCGSPTSSFAEKSVNFDPTNNFIGLGVLPEINSSSAVTFAFNFRYDLTGFPATQVFIANNQSNNRQFTIETAARGSVGEFRIAFGSSLINLSSIFAPDNTFEGQWWSHVVVTFLSGNIQLFADGKRITLQNPTGSMPIAIPSATTAVLIGANNQSTPTNKFRGQMLNVAIWNGWTADLNTARTLWNYNNPTDYRNISEIPTPTYYLPFNSGSTQEIIKNTSLSGSMPSASSQFPIKWAFSDEMFEHRFVINEGNEPWLGTSMGSQGKYTATPSICFDSQERLMYSYSRGVDHVNAHTGTYGFAFSGTFSDPLYPGFPIGERRNPYDLLSGTALIVPHGVLNGGSKRNFTLTMLSLSGTNRIFFGPFNETALPTVTGSDGRSRYIWSMFTDNDASSFSTPTAFSGSGTNWNSVGRARPVIRKNDGSILFGYYYNDTGQNRYTSGVARSTNSGSTFSHFSIIAQDSNVNGVQFEEPYFIYAPDNTLIAFMRVDNDRTIRRATSSDHGSTWSSSSIVTGGWQNPVFLYRESDNLMFLLNRTDANGDPDYAHSVLKISRDFGITWSAEQAIPIDTEGRGAQGDFWLTKDNKVGVIWAQDSTGSASSTRCWAGILRDCWISGVVATL